MIEEVNDLLPAWFTDRMMHDVWYFGLLLTNGQVMGIKQICSIRQAEDKSIWLDVVMMSTEEGHFAATKVKNLFTSPTERQNASVNATHVIAAFELADT